MTVDGQYGRLGESADVIRSVVAHALSTQMQIMSLAKHVKENVQVRLGGSISVLVREKES